VNDPACAQCGTPIVDTATLRKRDGVVFCCANCIAAADGAGGSSLACAHCGTPIVDTSSEVEIDQQVFCCHNCAQVHAGMSLRRSGA